MGDSLSFVKVVDPGQNNADQNDKRDNNDSKLKKKYNHIARGDSTRESGQDLRNITGRANSDLNSVNATGPSIIPMH